MAAPQQNTRAALGAGGTLCARLETEKGLEEGINPYRRNAEQVIHEGFRTQVSIPDSSL